MTSVKPCCSTRNIAKHPEVSRASTPLTTKTQQMAFPQNFLSKSDWPKTKTTMATTESVIVGRLRRGGVKHPSEALVKQITALILCCHYDDTQPTPDEAHTIVLDVKRLFKTPVPPGTEPNCDLYIEFYPDTPDGLVPQLHAHMYDTNDPPEPKQLDRMVYMTGLIPMRTSSKTLSPSLPIVQSSGAGARDGASMVLQFLASCMNQSNSKRGGTSTPGPHIEEVAESEALARQQSAPQLPLGLRPGALSAHVTHPLALGDAGARLSPASAPSLTCGGSAAGGGPPEGLGGSAAADAVAEMERAAAVVGKIPDAPPAKKPKGKGKGKGRPKATGKGTAKAKAKAKDTDKGKDVTTTDKYKDFYKEMLYKLLRDKVPMSDAHKRTKAAAKKKFKL